MHSFLARQDGGEWTFDHQKIKSFAPSFGVYREGAGNVWAFFFRKYANGKRGIDWFIEERGKRYSVEEREILEHWQAMRITCFQVVEEYEQGMVIEDIWSGERYRMPYCETMMKLPPWTVSIGMIEPYFEEWCIHGATMWGHPDVRSEVMTRVRQLQEESMQASGQQLSPSEVIAGHYPEMINLCHRVNKSSPAVVQNLEEMREQTSVLQWVRDEQEKHPGASIEMLVRRKEYEQHRANQAIKNRNYLRVALGLPASPFAN